MNTRALLAAAALTASLGVASQAAAAVNPIYSTSEAGNQAFTGTLGLDFTVNRTTTLDGLGAFTNGATDIQVALYDLTTGTTVGATTVTSSSGAVVGSYIYNAVNLVVNAGDTYQIAAFGYSSANPNYNPDGGTAAGAGSNPQVNFNTLYGTFTEGSSFYNTSTAGIAKATTLDTFAGSYGAGSISALPEPASWALMFAGVGLVGGALRLRRRSAAAAVA